MELPSDGEGDRWVLKDCTPLSTVVVGCQSAIQLFELENFTLWIEGKEVGDLFGLATLVDREEVKIDGITVLLAGATDVADFFNGAEAGFHLIELSLERLDASTLFDGIAEEVPHGGGVAGLLGLEVEEWCLG